jgi:sulfur-carrier protein
VIRVVLPAHLRTLASAGREIELEVAAPVTQRSVIDAIEVKYPMLRGTIRDPSTKQRRSLVRFFACQQDLSHESPDAPLPESVANGTEPYMVVGAMAGGKSDQTE